MDLEAAVRLAKQFVSETLRNASTLGQARGYAGT